MDFRAPSQELTDKENQGVPDKYQNGELPRVVSILKSSQKANCLLEKKSSKVRLRRLKTVACFLLMEYLDFNTCSVVFSRYIYGTCNLLSEPALGKLQLIIDVETSHFFVCKILTRSAAIEVYFRFMARSLLVKQR